MRFVPTSLSEVVMVVPTVHRDARGFFLETYHAPQYAAGGIRTQFVQDNHSRSVAGTLRGLHAQAPRLQAKLMRVLRGEIWDVAVDIRRGSPTFGRHVGVTLSAENFRQLFIPEGFAHGFCVMSDVAEVEYKCSEIYRPDDEIAIAWNDPDLAIPWPLEQPLLSERDQRAPPLRDLLDRLPLWRGEETG